MKHRYVAFGCALIMQLAGAAVAAEATRPLIAPAPDWVLPARADAPPPAASDAPVQILLSDQQVRITAEAVETYYATRVKIQTPQGLDAMGAMSFSWQPDNDVLTMHRLAVERDGQARDLVESSEDFTILRREDQLEQAVLTGMLTALVQPPGLRVGDIIEMSYTLRRRDPVVHDAPDATYIWANSPMNNARLRVLWPESLAMRWRASSHMPAGEPEKSGGWMDLSYQLDEAVPLPQPAGAPARHMALRMLELTSYRDWQALSQRLAPLYVEASRLATDSPLRAEADRIRRAHARPEDRAAAALRLVQDEIRYVLLAMSDGGLKPATADETWQRRFGDCKAKSALLLALLRELGIEAEVAAVSSALGDGLDQRLPGVGVFDHVLVRARIGDNTYWLDGTRSGDRALARLQPPPFRWALPLVTRGSDLVAIPLEQLKEPEELLSLQIDATAGVSVPAPFKAEFRLSGDSARELKQNFDGVPEATRDEGLRAFWRQQYRGLEIESTQVEFDDALGVLTWSASGTITMEWDPDYNTYQPHSMGLGYRADYTRPRGADTEAPYAVAFPTWTRTIETITLPAQREPFTVTGSDINQVVAGGEFRRTAKVENGVFTAERNYRSVAPEFPAAEREAAERTLLEMSRNNLYLKKPEEYRPTRAELLTEVDIEYDNAEHYWTLGVEMSEHGLHAEAQDAFAKALELDPKHEPTHISRALALRMQGDVAGGVASLEAGLAELPGSVQIKDLLVIMLVDQKAWPRALELLDELIEGSPSAMLHSRRAMVHVQMNNPDLALRDADAVIALDSGKPDGYLTRIAVLKELGREAEVGAIVATLREKFGSEPAFDDFLVVMLKSVGLPALALEIVNEQISRNPNAVAYMQRADLQEDKSAILADLRAALSQVAVSFGVQVQLANMLLQKGWNRELVELLDEFEERASLHSRASGLRGIAHWRLGDQASAMADFSAAREFETDVHSLNNLCWDKAAHDVALEIALEECNEELAARPDCAHCMDSRAFVLLRLGRFDESIQAYDTALQMRPGQAHSLYGRGIARIRQGNREAGEGDLAQARVLSAAVEAEYQRMGVAP